MISVPAILIGLGLLLILGGLRYTRRWKKARRTQLLTAPFPETWDQILRHSFETYPRLPSDLREKLQGFTAVIASEKSWEACGGLSKVTEEMRVLVSAQAALLLLGRGQRDDFYPRLKSILVYPGAFRDRGNRLWGLPEEDHTDRAAHLGESWSTGSVILAWDSVKRGAADTDDGMNVTYHEFAHQLDQVDGAADGVPVLTHSISFKNWARVMAAEFDGLVGALEENDDHLIYSYGATNPAEFFAVGTETFFEKPRQLREEHPELYDEFQSFYQLDPAAWPRRENSGHPV